MNVQHLKDTEEREKKVLYHIFYNVKMQTIHDSDDELFINETHNQCYYFEP